MDLAIGSRTLGKAPGWRFRITATLDLATPEESPSSATRLGTAIGRQVGAWWKWWPELALLATLAALLLVLRPLDPFEWDELLYLRALEHYDVSQHSPHPPGAPAYVAAGRMLRPLVRDPVVTLQLLSIISALASAALLWRLVMRETGRRGPALAAALGLAVMPGFLFYGNVGLTDVPGVAATLATLLLAAVAADRPERLPAVALAASVTLAIRPHLILALAPVGLAVVVIAVRRRAWRDLRRAFVVALVACFTIWLPAILLTGWKAYWTTMKIQSEWVVQRDGEFAFPRAALGDVLRHWLIDPLGKRELAVPFYLLAASGAVGWWRSGARRLVLVSVASALVFLGGSACNLTYSWGVRYGLPLFPFLTALAAGNLVWRQRWLRATMALASSILALLLLGWSKGTLMKRLEPAPIWAGMQYIGARYDPRDVTVLVGSGLWPYADYLLKRAGFTGRGDIGNPTARQQSDKIRNEIYVGINPIPGMVAERDDTWVAPRLQQLSFGRGQRCVVQRLSAADMPRFSSHWQVRSDGWLVVGKGTISLAPGSIPHHGSLCIKLGRATVSSWGLAAREVKPGECTEVQLRPGPTGEVTVTPEKDWVLVQPAELIPPSDRKTPGSEPTPDQQRAQATPEAAR